MIKRQINYLLIVYAQSQHLICIFIIFYLYLIKFISRQLHNHRWIWSFLFEIRFLGGYLYS